eukprot:sb/3476629/
MFHLIFPIKICRKPLLWTQFLEWVDTICFAAVTKVHNQPNERFEEVRDNVLNVILADEEFEEIPAEVETPDDDIIEVVYRDVIPKKPLEWTGTTVEERLNELCLFVNPAFQNYDN